MGSLEGTFEKIFEKNYSRLYYYALYIVQDTEVARDMVHDVFARMWENFSLDKKCYTDSYLRMCVRNRCLDYLKHSKIEAAYVKFCIELTQRGVDWEVDKDEERLELIRSVVEKMPLRTRFIMDQCFYEGHTYKEVSAILGISVSSVKQHVMKALKLLRDAFSSKNPNAKLPQKYF